ncbi:MAG: hypothetical protein NXH78_01970 [Hyphomonadaceae bacterium]|nr:hypothetical protein [Hyphomonadaceae bacterium]
MAQNTVKIPENAEPLSHAWISYMAYFREDPKRYRDEFYSRRRPKLDESPEETDLRIRRSEVKEKDWRNDLLSEIRDGKFVVLGRDITDRIDAPLTDIPISIFEELNSNVSIDWDNNHVIAYGRKIIDVLIAPKPVESDASLVSTNEQAVAPERVFPEKPGATSYEAERRRAILTCYERKPEFLKWKVEKRIEYAKSVADELFPGLGFNDKQGDHFSRSTFYNTIKSLKDSGLLPSKNVQK